MMMNDDDDDDDDDGCYFSVYAMIIMKITYADTLQLESCLFQHWKLGFICPLPGVLDGLEMKIGTSR